MRQGAALILLSLALIPAVVLLAALFPPNDVFIESHPSDTAFEKISQALLLTMFLLGAARMAYAYLFITPATPTFTQQKTLGPATATATTFGSWKATTGELIKASSGDLPSGTPFQG